MAEKYNLACIQNIGGERKETDESRKLCSMPVALVLETIFAKMISKITTSNKLNTENQR